MELISQGINQMVQNMQTSSTLKEDEYIGSDGLIYCKKCNTRRQTEEIYFGKHQPIMCKCKKEEYEDEQQRLIQKEKNLLLDKLRKASLIGDKYKDVNFTNTIIYDEDFKKVFDRCKKYCEVADEVLKRGIGIYLYGTKGVGKSRLTACMCNELISKYYTVLYTNFSEISKNIRNTFNSKSDSELEFIEKLTSIDFLFIDDFGTELVTKNGEDNWLQEKIFEVINKRYNNNKPTIFTSNYSLQELINDRGLADKTVDRIFETCEVMKLIGTSYRISNAKNRKRLF